MSKPICLKSQLRERNANPCKGQIHAGTRKRANQQQKKQQLTYEAAKLNITVVQLRQQKFSQYQESAAIIMTENARLQRQYEEETRRHYRSHW